MRILPEDQADNRTKKAVRDSEARLLPELQTSSRKATPQHAFCETVTAGPHSPWHIRPLTAIGLKLGGGADTNALCGRKVAWDLQIPITDSHLEQNACHRCREIYKTQR